MAKTDLNSGDVIDEIGGFKTYGVLDNSEALRAENLLPLGLARDCVLRNAVRKDAALTLDDIEFPAGRLCDQLWREQLATFA